MSQVTLNPYSTIGTQFSAGLGTMITAYPNTVTMAQLLAEVWTIVSGTYYSTANTQVALEGAAVGGHAVNSYVNRLIQSGKSTFNDRQMKFIDMLIGPRITSNLPVLSLNNWILDVEDNITKSDLTVEEQIPLLIATMIGETAYTYWTADVANGSPAWHNYYQTQVAENYANIPFWVAAAMEGALSGFGADANGLIEPTTAEITVRMVSALIGALAVNTAKVALQVIPRIQPSEIADSIINMHPWRGPSNQGDYMYKWIPGQGGWKYTTVQYTKDANGKEVDMLATHEDTKTPSN